MGSAKWVESGVASADPESAGIAILLAIWIPVIAVIWLNRGDEQNDSASSQARMAQPEPDWCK